MSELPLIDVWNKRLELYTEGDKLRAEGHKLYAEGYKLYAEGDKLRAEGYKLHAEGDKLRAEAKLLWINAVLEKYGNITMEWIYQDGGYDCHLGNGDVYRHN